MEFPHVHEAATEAERQAAASPTAAAFFSGKAVEVAVKWAFRTDPGLRLPYQDNTAALLHEPSFKQLAGPADHIALSRLRRGKALTPADLVELEKMLVEAGIGDAEAIERAREASVGFGRFV